MEMFGFVLLGVVSPLLQAISNDSILENGSRCQKTIFEKNKKNRNVSHNSKRVK